MILSKQRTGAESPSFFSIVIPALNSSSSISRCLNSIILQTFCHFEVIVADGGSTDDTIDKVIAFQDKRIRVESQPDLGIFDGMSRGIGKSLGRWVLVLGSDDELFCSLTLEQAYHFLVKDGCQSFTAAYGNAFIRGNTGWAEDGETYMGSSNLPLLIRKNICQQAIFYKGETIRRKELQFHNHLGGNGGDHFCNVRLWLLQPFAYIPMTVCIFHAGGTSSFTRSQFRPSELLASDVWPQYRPLKPHARLARIRLLMAWKLPRLYKLLAFFASSIAPKK